MAEIPTAGVLLFELTGYDTVDTPALRVIFFYKPYKSHVSTGWPTVYQALRCNLQAYSNAIFMPYESLRQVQASRK